MVGSSFQVGDQIGRTDDVRALICNAKPGTAHNTRVNGEAVTSLQLTIQRSSSRLVGVSDIYFFTQSTIAGNTVKWSILFAVLGTGGMTKP